MSTLEPQVLRSVMLKPSVFHDDKAPHSLLGIHGNIVGTIDEHNRDLFLYRWSNEYWSYTYETKGESYFLEGLFRGMELGYRLALDDNKTPISGRDDVFTDLI